VATVQLKIKNSAKTDNYLSLSMAEVSNDTMENSLLLSEAEDTNDTIISLASTSNTSVSSTNSMSISFSNSSILDGTFFSVVPEKSSVNCIVAVRNVSLRMWR